MAGTSDYKKQIERDKLKFQKETAIAAKIKNKLWTETIKASELAAYLSCYSRNGVHFDSAKVKDRIEEICNMSNGLLNVDDFRKEPGNSKSMYLFPPKIHGLILTLLDTGYFDNRKNERLLSTRENLYREITVNVDLYLQQQDREIVESNPAFANAKCESILSEAINYKMQQLIRETMHSDEVIRVKLLKRTYEKLCELTKENEKEATHIFCSKLVYKEAFAGMKDEDYLKELFGADNLLNFIIDLLALRLKSKDYESLDENEKLKYPKLYAKAAELAKNDKLWVELEDVDIEALLEELKVKAVADDKYQRIMIKALEIFDKEDPDEMQLFEDLVYLTRVRFMAKKVTTEGAIVSKKFYEASFAKDIFDLLREFTIFDGDTPVIQEFRRINAVNAIKKNN